MPLSKIPQPNQFPKIFDHALYRKRRKRLREDYLSNHPLHRYLGSLLQERLEFVRQNFQSTLVIGDFTPTSPQLGGNITYLNHANIQDSQSPSYLTTVGDSDFLPFAYEQFDLIISYFELHRVNDIPGALAQVHRILKPNGLFMGVLLGGDSLVELRSACHKAELSVRGGVSPRVVPMVSVYDAAALMQRAGFSLPVVDHELITRSYQNSLDCLKDLKQLGLSNTLISQEKGFMGKNLFQEILRTYQTEFSENDKVFCSYDIIFLSGWRA